jgi:hypothetical protein
MKIVNIGGGGFIGARLRKRLRRHDDESAPRPPASGANTLGVRGIRRLGADANGQSLSTHRAPQIDWQDDPR